MKNLLILLLALLSLSFASCEKEEEPTIDNPDTTAVDNVITSVAPSADVDDVDDTNNTVETGDINWELNPPSPTNDYYTQTAYGGQKSGFDTESKTNLEYIRPDYKTMWLTVFDNDEITAEEILDNGGFDITHVSYSGPDFTGVVWELQENPFFIDDLQAYIDETHRAEIFISFHPSTNKTLNKGIHTLNITYQYRIEGNRYEAIANVVITIT